MRAIVLAALVGGNLLTGCFLVHGTKERAVDTVDATELPLEVSTRVINISVAGEFEQPPCQRAEPGPIVTFGVSIDNGSNEALGDVRVDRVTVALPDGKSFESDLRPYDAHGSMPVEPEIAAGSRGAYSFIGDLPPCAGVCSESPQRDASNDVRLTFRFETSLGRRDFDVEDTLTCGYLE